MLTECFSVMVLIGISLIHFSTSQSIPCSTPDQEEGECIPVKSCGYLVNIIITQGSNPNIQRRLKSFGCGFNRNGALACCPVTKVKSPTIPPVTASSKPDIPDEPLIKYENRLLKPPHCGISNGSAPRIVGGEDATIGEFPWAVILGYRNKLNPKLPRWLCGGSLITYKHVLTAAHCAYNRRDLYLARLAEFDLYSNADGDIPEDIELVEAKIHENYNPTTFTSDIAILVLKRIPETPTVIPVCLPFYEPYKSKNYIGKSPLVIGWGSIYFNGPSSDKLQKLGVKVVNNDRCKVRYQSQAIIDDRIVCGEGGAGKDSCKGDSGGPLMFSENVTKKQVTETGLYVQIGIVSYGYRCAEPGYPGVYTNVVKFIDWIQEKIR